MSTSAARSSFFNPALPIMATVKLAAVFGLAKPALKMMGTKSLFPRKIAGGFRGYTAREHDVFVATFAKSGTNWAMQIAHQIAWHGEGDYNHIHDVIPWPEAPMGYIVPLSDPATLERSPTHLRVIKTHVGAPWVPYSPEAKYLTIVRDPKDVFVSSYHFVLGLFGLLDRISPPEWYELFLAPNGFADAWCEHTASYWSLRDRDNHLMLTFRELKADLRGGVERVASLMGVELTPAALERVVERASFPYMKAQTIKFNAPPMPFVDHKRQPVMIRRGEVGVAEELLSAEQAAQIDQHCRARLLEFDSDFPYDAHFVSTGAN